MVHLHRTHIGLWMGLVLSSYSESHLDGRMMSVVYRRAVYQSLRQIASEFYRSYLIQQSTTLKTTDYSIPRHTIWGNGPDAPTYSDPRLNETRIHLTVSCRKYRTTYSGEYVAVTSSTIRSAVFIPTPSTPINSSIDAFITDRTLPNPSNKERAVFGPIPAILDTI